MSDQIKVNGNVHSWGSIIFKVAGDRFYGFTSISYADKRERSKTYGMGKHHAPRGRTRGKYTTEPVKVKGPKDTCNALRKKLAELSQSGTSYGDTEFEIVVQYVESDLEPITVELADCTYVGTTTSDEESAEALTEEIEIDTMAIRRNGLALFDDSEGAPA